LVVTRADPGTLVVVSHNQGVYAVTVDRKMSAR